MIVLLLFSSKQRGQRPPRNQCCTQAPRHPIVRKGQKPPEDVFSSKRSHGQTLMLPICMAQILLLRLAQMFPAHKLALQKASKCHPQVGMVLKEDPGATLIYSSPLSVQLGLQACDESWTMGCWGPHLASSARSKIGVLISCSSPSTG